MTRVGLAGYGMAGRDIHAPLLKDAGLEVVAISTSNAFILPSANPVIMIVSGPGGYRQRDFLRVGIPLTVLMLTIMLVAVNLVFGRG